MTFGQWLKLGFGGMAWFNKNRAVVDDAIAFREKHRGALDELIALYRSVVPPEPGENPFVPSPAPSEVGTVGPAEVIQKIRTGSMTQAEQAQFDRASQLGG